VSHANAALTPRHRLRLARLIVEDKWPISRAAAAFQVYRQSGPAGGHDRPEFPTAPQHTPDPATGGPPDRARSMEAAAGGRWKIAARAGVLHRQHASTAARASSRMERATVVVRSL